MQGIRTRFGVALAVAIGSIASADAWADVRINEIRVDQTGTDNDEYFELTGTPGESLDGLTYIVIGDGAAAAGSGVIEAVVSLDGKVIGADGFFLVTETTFTLGTPDFTVGATGLNFENDDNFTHLLVRGFTGTNGQDLDNSPTAAGDGTLDTTPWTSVVDEVALVKSLSSTGTEFFYSATTVGPDGSFVPGHALRLPDGTGAFRVGNFAGGEDSPGEANSRAVATEAAIFEIQGAGHASPFLNEKVRTTGVVTAVDSNGFYLQDLAGDGDVATSDAILVFTSSAPTVAVGDSVEVEGVVTEFTPGGTSTGNLSTTEIVSPFITTVSTGATLPAAVLVGTGGRVPPNVNIEDDDFASFDPAADGIDFYESLEAMRVVVGAPVAVSPTNGFGETWVLASEGAGATGRNARGGITISETDYNPERIQVQYDTTLAPGFTPALTVGDLLGDVTGVVSYNFGNFELVITEEFDVTAGGLVGESTTLTGASDQLTIAGYNVFNLDPNDADGNTDIADGQFAVIAAQIVGSLHSPDIVALQEVQDNSGSTNDGTVAANVTLDTLVSAIAAAGGRNYAHANLDPEDGQDGGEPGGNIRVAYLYDPARVALVSGSLQRITDTDLADGDAFANSRKPLVAEFEFNTRRVTLVNNHFTSKGGGTPIFGRTQPFVNGGEAQRTAQATVVRGVVDGILGADANANVVVLGDLNDFDFSEPLEVLEGSGAASLTNLTTLLLPSERYSYVFEGNSQSLDHVFVSAALLPLTAHDVVHVNAEFPDGASDHDPQVIRIHLAGPSAADVLAYFDAAVRAGTLKGQSNFAFIAGIELAVYRLHLAAAVVAERYGFRNLEIGLLQSAFLLADGMRSPGDFVKGTAQPGLAKLLTATLSGLQ